MEEIYVPLNLEGFRDSHLVSNFGNIKTVKGRILKQRLDKDGYLQVNLYNKGYEITKKVHRLVALTFLSNPNNYSTINHIDGIKTNNNISNLEWCTVSYNTQHAYDNNLAGKGFNHSKSKSFVLKDLNGNIISQYDTIINFASCICTNRLNATNFIKKELNIEFIDKAIEGVEINKKLNPINNEKVIECYKVMDLNHKTLAVYSSACCLEKYTEISRRITPKITFDEPYFYKQRKKNGNKFYIQKITLIEFLTIETKTSNDYIK